MGDDEKWEFCDIPLQGAIPHASTPTVAPVLQPPSNGGMNVYKLLYLTPVLLLAACSRQQITTTASSAQNPATEPVQRTAPTQSTPASPYDNPVPNAQPTGNPPPAQPQTDPPAAPNDATAPPASAPPAYNAPVIPAGTDLHVRLDESLGTKTDRTGERFYATLSQPVTMNGVAVLPTGARFVGHLTESKPSGRLKGRAVLAIRLDGVEWHGRTYPVTTSSFAIATRGRKRHDIKWIGGGSGVGAVFGAIAGGGEGALIGAAAGAGAGTAGALIRPRKQVRLRAETPVIFRLRAPLQL